MYDAVIAGELKLPVLEQTRELVIANAPVAVVRAVEAELNPKVLL